MDKDLWAREAIGRAPRGKCPSHKPWLELRPWGRFLSGEVDPETGGQWGEAVSGDEDRAAIGDLSD